MPMTAHSNPIRTGRSCWHFVVVVVGGGILFILCVFHIGWFVGGDLHELDVSDEGI